MITDEELIDLIRETDPVAEIPNDLLRSSSSQDLLRSIQARLATGPTVSIVEVSSRDRTRWLAIAAVALLVAGSLALGVLLKRSADETVTGQTSEGADELSPTEPPFDSSPEGARIERVSTDGLGDGHIRAAVATGRGVVAVGHGAAVWSSPDGVSWSRSEIDTRAIDTGRFDIAVNDVIAGGPGLIAVGAIEQDRFFGVPESEYEARDRCLDDEIEPCNPDWPEIETGAAVWVSTDGTDWTRTFTDVSAGGAVIQSVVEGGPGYIAVGSNAVDGEVWTSEDGLDWSPSDDTRAFAGHQILEVFSTPSNLVAVGSAAWTSVDGSAWQLASELEDPWYVNGDVRKGIRSVADGPYGYVGVGFSGIWTSVDGTHWVRVPEINDAIGNSHLDVVYGNETGYVAFGQSSLGGPGAAFVSTDAITWIEIPYEETVKPDDVVEIDGRVLIVGSGDGDTGQLRPVVWELVSELEE